MFNTCFGSGGPIGSVAAYAEADTALQARFLVELQERGVRPTARGTWFLSTTHDDADSYRREPSGRMPRRGSR